MQAYYENDEREFRCERGLGFSFPCHLHQQIELIYVEEGEIKIQIADQERIMAKGEIAVVFPNMIHSYIQLEGAPARIILLIFGQSFTGNFRQKLSSCHPAYPYIGVKELHPDVPYAIMRLMEETENRYAIQALTELILARLFPYLTLKKNRQSATEELTYQAACYLSEHFLEPVTLSSTAKALGVNKYYLSRVFSEKFQVSFPDYINQMRVHHATNLIRQTKLPFMEVAFQSGFNSQRSFNRAFAKYLQMTPKEYRKTYFQNN